MARPRVNDAENTRMPPNLAAPERVPLIVNEFKSRLRFLSTNYHYGKQLLGNAADFNRSLKRLRSALASGGFTRPTPPDDIASGRMTRIHPELELVILYQAGRFAEERGGKGAELTASDISRAARYAASVLEVRRGAPPDSNLRHHVEALVALAQEVSGTPVLVEKMRGLDYDPHFVGTSGYGGAWRHPDVGALGRGAQGSSDGS